MTSQVILFDECLINFGQLDMSKVIWENDLNWENASTRWTVASLWGTFSWAMIDVEGRIQLWVALSLDRWSSGV